MERNENFRSRAHLFDDGVFIDILFLAVIVPVTWDTKTKKWEESEVIQDSFQMKFLLQTKKGNKNLK